MNGFAYGPGMMGGFPMQMGAFSLLVIWTLVWKGLALWHAARRQERWWFLALLIINTMGILEIVYLFLVAKISKEQLIPMEDAPKAPPSAPSTPSAETHH